MSPKTLLDAGICQNLSLVLRKLASFPPTMLIELIISPTGASSYSTSKYGGCAPPAIDQDVEYASSSKPFNSAYATALDLLTPSDPAM